jgi:hypothetical protein|tara:strand:- start:675 stop:884 length:210 start_codon:yes stop_codon:yes gene_type:complete
MSGASASDFTKWAEHAKTVCLDSLKYIISDCAKARDAMKDWNPEKYNYYSDMGFTYSDELYKRTKGALK